MLQQRSESYASMPQMLSEKKAVPSVNLPKCSTVDRSYISNNVLSALREQRQIKRASLTSEQSNNTRKQTSEESTNFNNDDNFQGFVDLNNQIDTTNEENLRVNKVINKLELPTKCNMEITLKQFNNVAIQMQIDHFIPKFSEFFSNDSEL
ncbi:hypothetical protein PV326_014220, partial [Microctonus aethiopoides]